MCLFAPPPPSTPMTVEGTSLRLNGRTIAIVGGPDAVMPLAELKVIAEQIATAWNANLNPKGSTDGEEKEG